MTTQTNKPKIIHRDTVKPLSLSIWEHQHTSANGSTFSSYSIEIQRCYKDRKSDSFKYTSWIPSKHFDKYLALQKIAADVLTGIASNTDVKEVA